MTGGESKLDLSSMPAVIFTDPQVAAVGMLASEARDADLEVRVIEYTHDDPNRPGCGQRNPHSRNMRAAGGASRR